VDASGTDRIPRGFTGIDGINASAGPSLMLKLKAEEHVPGERPIPATTS